MQPPTHAPLTTPRGLPAPSPAAQRVQAPHQDGLTPRLPKVTPAMPSPGPSHGTTGRASSPTAHSPHGPRPSGKRGGRRALKWAFTLAIVGGLAYGGVMYGPELVARASGDFVDEPAVAREFPAATLPPTPVRTATYTVEHYADRESIEEFAVTADFEAGVSLVTVQRQGRDDVDVLSVLDQSYVRELDGERWWSVPRGQFPVDPWQDKSRWVRTLDEVIPPAARDTATIERATESSVAGVPTTRLLVSIDPNLLASARPPRPAPGASGAEAPPPPPPAVLLPPGMGLRPQAALDTPLQIELWVDGSGLVRKLVLPEELGGETITITSVSEEAFAPAFPSEDQTRPLSADSFFLLAD